MSTHVGTGKGPFTVEDLLSTPEDHVKRELIDGWLYVEGQRVDSLEAAVAADEVTGPRLVHQDVVLELASVCRGNARRVGAKVYVAPVDVVLGGEVVQPDVLVVGPGEVAALAGAARIEGVVPQLVAEVSSPSTRSHDLLRKRRIYQDVGVAEFWFVDLEARWIAVYQLGGDGYPAPIIHECDATVTSRALPGLRIAVAEVLPDD